MRGKGCILEKKEEGTKHSPGKWRKEKGNTAVTRLPVSSWSEAGSVFKIKCEELY